MAQPTRVTLATLKTLSQNLDYTIEDLEERAGEAEGAKAEAFEEKLTILEDFRSALEECISDLEQ